VGQFDLALSIDSSYAEAWVGLARARLAREIDPRVVVPSAREAVRRAMTLAPRLGAAHAELARLQFWFEWDWEGAERSFRRALELDPRSASARHDFALLLAARGRHDEALRQAVRARELDPASPAIATDIGVVYYLMRRYEDASRAAEGAIEVEPGYQPALTLLYASALRQDRPAVAMAYARRFMPASLLPPDVASGEVNDWRAVRAVAEALLGWLARTPERAPESSVLRAQQHVMLGQPDSALTWLDRGYSERERWMVFASVEPGLDPLRTDPRFTRLMQRMGL
jgi:tetratricopeptide (TPR) repeat protein